MAARNDEMPTGWPFGLRLVNLRLRVMEPLQADSMEPYQLSFPSISFSSFSSSNLGTDESLASYLQDNTVSLAQLIGNRSSGDRGRLNNSNSSSVEGRNKTLAKGSCSNGSKEKQGRDESRVSCISRLLNYLLLKIRRSKMSSRS